jgi:hypothetical protein
MHYAKLSDILSDLDKELGEEVEIIEKGMVPGPRE